MNIWMPATYYAQLGVGCNDLMHSRIFLGGGGAIIVVIILSPRKLGGRTLKTSIPLTYLQ